MKAILAFAFLVLAAQAATPAYFLGFTEQIGLSGDQMKHGSICFDSIHKVLADVHNLVQGKKMGVSEALRSVIELVEDFEHKLKVDCSVYMNDIASTFFRKYQGGDLKEVAKKNWNTYPAEIIQQIVRYFDFIAERNDYEAGRTEAYIYQILLGLEQPKVLPLPKRESSGVVEVNVTEALTNFTKSYYETLGLFDNKGIKDNIDCSLVQVAMNENMQPISWMLSQARTTSEKLHVYEKLIHEGIKIYDACADAYVFHIEHVVLPILKAFKVAPVHATMAVVHNVALNFPEMKQRAVQMMVDAEEGRASETGKIYAEFLITIFSNIYPRYY